MQQLYSTPSKSLWICDDIWLFFFLWKTSSFPDVKNRTGALRNPLTWTVLLFFFSSSFMLSLKLEAETRSCSRCSLICGGQMKTCIFQIIITLWKPITIHLSVKCLCRCICLQHKNLTNNKIIKVSLEDEKQTFDLVTS